MFSVHSCSRVLFIIYKNNHFTFLFVAGEIHGCNEGKLVIFCISKADESTQNQLEGSNETIRIVISN